MNKPQKSANGGKALPRTDAEALNDIVEWSSNRAPWQRQALRLLMKSPSLMPEQLDELYLLSKSGSHAREPIEQSDVRSAKSSAAVVTLKAVINPEDVNALAPDQSLSFMQSGLTIVYGDNGAGKSGYARILKQACRARLEAKPAPILSNIFEQAAGTPRAKIAYSINSQNRQIDWRSDACAPAELSAVSVFDARTASVHVDGTNEVAYTPYALELMQRLAQTAEALRAKCKREQTDIANATPEALRSPPIAFGTQVAEALAQLNSTSDLKHFEELAVLTNGEQVEHAGLRQDLGADQAKVARHMTDSSAGLLRFADAVQNLCTLAGGVTHTELRQLKSDMRTTREAADAAARTSFAGEPLQQVGSEAWRKLWEAARRYAVLANPGEAFPPASGPCPLCQRDLSEEAVDRLRRFEAFVKDDTKQSADAAEKAYDERMAALRAQIIPASQIAEKLRFIGTTLSDEKATNAARILIKAVWQLRRIVRRHDDPELCVDDLDPSGALAELRRLATQLKVRARSTARQRRY